MGEGKDIVKILLAGKQTASKSLIGKYKMIFLIVNLE